MDTTASSFSTRGNAKRSAEQMIKKGAAPAAHYSIERRDNGRFQLVWMTAPTIAESAEAAEAHASEPNRRHMFGSAEGETRLGPNRNASKVETEIPGAGTHDPIPPNGPTSWTSGCSEPAPVAPNPEPENKWPDGAHVMVRKHRSWREAKIISRLGSVLLASGIF
jgi:hypothetical protein